MTKNEQIRLISSVVFLVAQILLLLGLHAKGYPDFMRSVAVTTYVWIIYSYFEFKYRFYMDNYVRMLVMTALLSDGFFGYYLEYYVESFVFDKVQHVFGTYAFSLFAYVLVVQIMPRKMPSRLFTFILVAALGISIGAFYEIAEFLVDQFAHPIIPSQAGLLDTDLDLICNILGSVLAGAQVSYTRFLAGFSLGDGR